MVCGASATHTLPVLEIKTRSQSVSVKTTKIIDLPRRITTTVPPSNLLNARVYRTQLNCTSVHWHLYGAADDTDHPQDGSGRCAALQNRLARLLSHNRSPLTSRVPPDHPASTVE